MPPSRKKPAKVRCEPSTFAGLFIHFTPVCAVFFTAFSPEGMYLMLF